MDVLSTSKVHVVYHMCAFLRPFRSCLLKAFDVEHLEVKCIYITISFNWKYEGMAIYLACSSPQVCRAQMQSPGPNSQTSQAFMASLYSLGWRKPYCTIGQDSSQPEK